MVRRLEETFGNGCVKENASEKFRTVFNTFGKEVLLSMTSYKAGTDVLYSLAL